MLLRIGLAISVIVAVTLTAYGIWQVGVMIAAGLSAGLWKLGKSRYSELRTDAWRLVMDADQQNAAMARGDVEYGTHGRFARSPLVQYADQVAGMFAK